MKAKIISLLLCLSVLFGTFAVGIEAADSANGTEHVCALEVIRTSEPTCTNDGYIFTACNECGITYRDVTPALGHSFVDGYCQVCGESEHQCTFELMDRIEATCTEDGVEYAICYECGNQTANTIPALGHSYTAEGVCEWCLESDPNYHECVWEKRGETEPTCTENGTVIYICWTCGTMRREPLSALGHDFVDGACTRCGESDGTSHECAWELTESVPATCSNDGYELYICTVCLEEMRNTLPALGHVLNSNGVCTVCGEGGSGGHECQFVEGECVEPTCISDGFVVMYCPECGDSYEEYIPAFGHDFVDGTCRRCGETEDLPDILVVPDHECVLTVISGVEPTCTIAGYVISVCDGCGLEYRDVLPAIGHSFTAEGICEWCGESGGEAHVCNPIAIEIVEPTCYDMGYTVMYCQECGNRYEDNFVPAKGHNYGKDGICTNCGEGDSGGDNEHNCSYRSEYVPKTCTENGYYRTYCEECGYEEYEYIYATGHEFSNGMCHICGYVDYNIHECVFECFDNGEATCVEFGYKFFICLECKAEKTEMINPIGHSFSTDGACASCGEIGEAGHACVIEIISSAEPTCVDEGYIVVCCFGCGIRTRTTLAATGHKADEDDICFFCGEYALVHNHAFRVLEHKDATCTEDGYHIIICDGCSAQQREDYPATGHEFDSNGMCLLCGYVNSGEHVHDFMLFDSTEPTCTDDGYEFYICLYCKAERRDTLPSPGHSFNETGVCTVCGKGGESDHECIFETITTPATCTESGYVISRCNGCGNEYMEPLPALGHQFTADGKCAYCGMSAEDTPTVYTVTVDGVVYEYSAGDTVTVSKGFYVNMFRGYRFNNWEGDVYVLDDVNAGTVSFVMPEANITLISVYVMVGDLSGDGAINSTDLNLTKQVISGGIDKSTQSDINGDGAVNAMDLNLFKRMLVGAYVPEE